MTTDVVIFYAMIHFGHDVPNCSCYAYNNIFHYIFYKNNNMQYLFQTIKYRFIKSLILDIFAK